MLGQRSRARIATVCVAVAATVLAVLPGTAATATTAPAPKLTTTQANLKTMVSATPKACMPAIHPSTAALATDKIDDEVEIGNVMYAVGSFSSATPINCTTYALGQPVVRHNVMAFDTGTGALTAFAPVLNGEVWAALPSASGALLYLCGSFTTANGVARTGLVKYTVATGAVDANFNAHLNGSCSDIKFVAGRLVVMGSFTKSGSSARVAIATVSQTTGATDAGNGFFGATAIGANNEGGATSIYRGFANPAGTAFVVIGNFGTVGGHKRHQIAMLGVGGTAASLDAWYSSGFDYVCKTSTGTYYSWLRDIAWSPDGTFFVVGGTGNPHANTFCDSIERFDYAPTNANEAPRWHMYTDGDTFHSMVVTSSAVYYAGHMRYIDTAGPVYPVVPLPDGALCDPHTPSMGSAGPSGGGSTFYYGYNCPTLTATYRPGIGALDPTTGTVLSWDPQRSRNEGAKSMYVTTSPPGLWVGSDGPSAGCAAPAGVNHDDCSGQKLLYVGGDAFFPATS